MTRKTKSKTKNAELKKQKRYRNFADALWSKLIRRIGHCEVCGREDSLNAHHLIERGVYYYRHNLDNGVCLCVSHHMWNKELNAENGTSQVFRFTEWLRINKPEQYAWWQEHMNDRPTDKVNFEAAYNDLLQYDLEF